jgi:hypothetical protein
MAVDTIAGLKAKMPLNVVGGTTVQDMHDLIDTFESLIAAAGSGGGGGTSTSDMGFITPLSTGCVKGFNRTAQERLNNGVNFQAAIDMAAGQSKLFYVPRGEWEIDLDGGLEVDDYGFRWIGHKHSSITQWADNSRIITFGKKDPAATQETAAQVIDGMVVRYGNDQASTNTSATAVVFARCWMGDYRNIDVGWVNEQYPNAKRCYRGVAFVNNFFFSNTLTNIRIKHFHAIGMLFAVQGTGNTFRNIYISNGNLNQTIGTVSYLLSLDAGGAVMQENVWAQLNLEWSNCFSAIRMVNARNQVFNSVHIEGVHARAADPYIALNSAASASFHGVTFLDCQPVAATKVFGMGWDANCVVSTVGFEKFNQTTPVTVALVGMDTGTEIRRSAIKIQALAINASVVLNSSDTTNQTGTNDLSRALKELSYVLPMTPGLTTYGDVDAVIAGRTCRQTIRFNTPLTANRACTLTAKYDFGTTQGGLLTLPNGCSHRVLRSAAATGAFTLTVNTSANSDGTSPTSLGTLAVGEFMDVIFEGGVWVVIGRGSLT